jgi:hypothetical protein
VKPKTGELADKAFRTHGHIAHDAALADSCLYEIFHHVAGCKREMSRAIYFTLDAINGRASLVTRAAEVAGADQQTKELIEALIKAVRKVISHRNGFSHSFLVFDKGIMGNGEHLKIVNQKGSRIGGTRVTEASLKNAEDQSGVLLRDAVKEFEGLCQKLGIPPIAGF